MGSYDKKLITGEAYIALGNKMKEYADGRIDDVEERIEQYEMIEEPDINAIISDIDNE